MVGLTYSTISRLRTHLDFSYTSCDDVCMYVVFAPFALGSVLGDILWVAQRAGIFPDSDDMHLGIFNAFASFLLSALFVGLYWEFLTFLFTLFVVLPISLACDVISILGIILFCLILITLQSFFYVLMLLPLQVFLIIQYSLVVIQFLVFSILGLCLHAYLYSYFFSFLLLRYCKRIYREKVSSLFLKLRSFASMICVVRRPRYRTNASRMPCSDICTKPLKSTLCAKCILLLDRSSLLTGTSWIFARPTEYHRHHTRADLELSALSCHLCNMLLRSISKWPLHYGTGSLDHLTVKIWQEMSISGRPRLRGQINDNPESDLLTFEEVHHGMIKPKAILRT